jgi:hypothetical protein
VEDRWDGRAPPKQETRPRIAGTRPVARAWRVGGARSSWDPCIPACVICRTAQLRCVIAFLNNHKNNYKHKQNCTQTQNQKSTTKLNNPEQDEARRLSLTSFASSETSQYLQRERESNREEERKDAEGNATRADTERS